MTDQTTHSYAISYGSLPGVGTPHLMFQHKPLDYSKGCIRLIRVLPGLSASGLIQCELLQSTTNSSYVCLSYMWGSSVLEKSILVNGNCFKIQDNLWNFLSTARRARHWPLSTLYWMDAICIDQSNTIERNHQVGQMGDVYRKAQYVLVWMGIADETSRTLSVAVKACDLLKRINSWSWFEEIARGDEEICNYQSAADWAQFLSHIYWRRAWITQEVLLAQSIWVLTDKVQIEGEQLRPICYLKDVFRDFYPSTQSALDLEKIAARSLEYFQHMYAPHRRHADLHMVRLLDMFPNRSCSIARDRFHSLAALANDGAQIPIDYALPDIEFYHRLLAALKASIACCCSVALIHNALGAPDLAYYNRPIFKLTMKVYQVQDNRHSELVHDMRDQPRGTFCTECLKDIKSDEDVTLCLKSLCSLMQGHLVGLRRRSFHRGWRVSVLRLITESHKAIVIALRELRTQREESGFVSPFLTTSELHDLVDKACTVDTTRPYGSLCDNNLVSERFLEVVG